MVKFTRFIIIFLNICYDIYKIINKKNVSWDYSYHSKKIYGYSDLIIEIKGVKKKEILIFIIIIFTYKILLKIQIFVFIYFLLKFLLKSILGHKINLKISKIFYKRIVIEYPKFIAFLLHSRISSLKLPTKKEINYIIINLNNVLLWNNVKFVINNTKTITKFVINLDKDPNFKLELNYIKLKIKYIYEYEFDENLKKFENTLLNGRD